MKINVDRSFLEINTIENLNQSNRPGPNFKIIEVDPPDFQLNKFFYKQIGRKHRWIDRLAWADKKWIQYVENPRIKTFILKDNNNLAGYYETIRDLDKYNCEIAYFGILEEYQNKKLGSFLLSEAIKKSFANNTKRVWVHTCSLDHKNALSNYISRGMKIFKTEILNI